ncbi:hypothetical protein [Evansella tamaricis]|uniref:Uncharacterized protein n=1 Tax=Evansella tamaricis TaxID=2069301 RepID=A0ABS6JKE1_9BACI|nr:hypothetical protein [Evansella tamaricis]MBU9714126.1 hypothetical protein [Evansella tamaricis]
MKSYSDDQNQVFIDHMVEYRDFIEGENPKETQRLTIEFARQMMKTVPLLSDRNIKGNGVAERLVYFDNLLAGVEFPFDYYLSGTKDLYFGKLPRKVGSKEPNKWKTQHEARREKDSL